jgi:biotin synthase
LGERPDEDLEVWRSAGANRYLLRFETSDNDLYHFIHPSLPGRESNRLAILKTLKKIGYETVGGIMIGIPGQTYSSLSQDIDLFRRLDLDMIGVGPYIPHPQTPLGQGEWKRMIPKEEQVPNMEQMTYKVIDLTRIVCPEANIPSTTALATLNYEHGRVLGLIRGANVVMPNLTPLKYRTQYEIYPSKACISETPSECYSCLQHQIQSIGRKVGTGQGHRIRLSESWFNLPSPFPSPHWGEGGGEGDRNLLHLIEEKNYGLRGSKIGG